MPELCAALSWELHEIGSSVDHMVICGQWLREMPYTFVIVPVIVPVS